MFGLGPLELLVIVILALLLIGPRQLPEVLKTIGKVMGDLRRATDDVRREILQDDTLQGMRDLLDPYAPPPPTRYNRSEDEHSGEEVNPEISAPAENAEHEHEPESASGDDKEVKDG